jgi:hypothetical protein
MVMGRVHPAVTWGLFVSWLVHDLEEVATVGAFAREYERRFGRRFPVSPEQMAVAVTAVGLLVGVASARGVSTGGRSTLFRQVLLAHAAHSAWHVAASIVTHGYTPGVVTATTVVGPHGWWALRHLRETEGWAGSDQLAQLRTAVPGAVVAALTAHLLARQVLRRRLPDRSRPPRPGVGTTAAPTGRAPDADR